MKYKAILLLLVSGLLCQNANAMCTKSKDYPDLTLDMIIEDIRIGNMQQRGKAITVLSEVCPRDAIKPLLVILGDSDPDASAAAALALGKMDEHSAIVPLADALLVKDIRSAAAATALGMLKANKAVPRLTKVLFKGKYQESRVNSAWALGEINDERADKFLLIAAKKDAALPVQAEALRACGKRKYKNAMPTILDRLGSKKEELRLAAVQALGLMKHLESRELLENVMLDDRAPQVRAEAASVVGELLFKESMPALQSAMKDKNPQVSEAATLAYNRINDALQHKLKEESKKKKR
ncbi:MAG: HEAT repeat domain-containing protein [Elusimicrobiaceae bacterium]|nr:HEAT repeat domain-containing protein [Elusimicrobiaceae bacterium]